MRRAAMLLTAMAIALAGCAPASPPPATGGPDASAVPACDLDDLLPESVGERPAVDSSIQWLGPSDVLESMGALCASTVIVGGGSRASLAIAPLSDESIAALSDALVRAGLEVQPRGAAPHIATESGRSPYVLTEPLPGAGDRTVLGHPADALMLVQYVASPDD